MPDDGGSEGGSGGGGGGSETTPTLPPPPPPPPPPPAAPPPSGKSTTGGAAMFGSNVWLTAGAVFAYSSYALWVKLRKMARKSKTNSEAGDEEPKDPSIKEDKEHSDSKLVEATDRDLNNSLLDSDEMPEILQEQLAST